MPSVIDFAALFHRSPNPYMLLDRELRFVEMNEAYLRATGRTRGALLGVALFEAFPANPDDSDDGNARELQASLMRVFRTGQPDVLGLIRYAIARETAGGTVFDERFWSATHTPIPGPDGSVAFVLQHTTDVTELQRLKAELQQARQHERAIPLEQIEGNVFTHARAVQEANRQLDAQRRHLLRLFEEAPGFMAFLRGPEHVFELANSAYLSLIGQRDVLGSSVREALPEIAGQGYYELLDRVYATGEAFVGRGMRVEIARQGGGGTEHVYVDFVYQPVLDADGGIAGIFLQGHDITAQAVAQAELDRYRGQLEDLVQARTQALATSESERRAAEAALLQAQKMDAVGKLTGGVAHDFNNVLQVIGANLQLLRALPSLEPAAQQRTGAALDAVERGAKLASQLLAFARRQPLNPVVFNLGARLRRLDDLLLRTLGEDVELALAVAPGLANVEADVHQLENVVLNLAINARDAMQRSGRLTIDSRNVSIPDEPSMLDPEVPPGHYVLLTVADTGHGMSEDVLQRAFEPFFTTKGEGRGTGLGLSMVYGFVKQSGGHIQIDSAPGCGTTVRIYLPRSDRPETQLAEPVAGPTAGGSETVLVVEDDAAVRDSVVDLLGALGYRTHAAADAQAALQLLQAGVPVDLLFTDVVMPGPIQSPELAQRARALLPGIAVLFTSGYTEDTIFHDGRLDPGIELLSKPYLHEALARRVRQLLDSRGASVEAAHEPPRDPVAATSLRILFVEDDDDNRMLTTELLRLFGHRVTAVGDAGEALAHLRGSAWDVLLTDVELPGMSGIELARQARAASPGLHVVFLSGHAAEQLRARGLAGSLVQKPFRPEQLQAALLARG